MDKALSQGNARVTLIGTATVILEIGSLRLLTDPALDGGDQGRDRPPQDDGEDG